MSENDVYKYKAHVNRVLDGDTADVTIDLGFDVHVKQRLRFYGVDCHETRSRDKAEKKKGLLAKEFTKNAIEGKDIFIHTNEKGKFGRYLATIFYGEHGTNLNNELILNGMAKGYWGGAR